MGCSGCKKRAAAMAATRARTNKNINKAAAYASTRHTYTDEIQSLIKTNESFSTGYFSVEKLNTVLEATKASVSSKDKTSLDAKLFSEKIDTIIKNSALLDSVQSKKIIVAVINMLRTAS